MQHKYNDDVALCCVLLIVQDDRLLCYDASLPFPGLVWAPEVHVTGAGDKQLVAAPSQVSPLWP